MPKTLSILVICFCSFHAVSCMVQNESKLEDSLVFGDDITSEERKVFQKYVNDIFRDYALILKGITDDYAEEATFQKTYQEFYKGCRLDLQIFSKRQFSNTRGYNTYSINVIALKKDQGDEDVSRLDAISISHFTVPEKYEFRWHRMPDSVNYPKILRAQSAFGGFMKQVMRKNSGCAETPSI